MDALPHNCQHQSLKSKYFNITVFYLINPATVRNPMKRVKPDQTPERPIIEGAQSRNADDIAPTTIYNKFVCY